MTKLRLAPDLSLPDDAVTQRLAFVGRPGSGKSYMATKLAELLYDIGAQFIALDPVGIWYGVRADGKGKGLDIPVFGGLHGDVPLEPGAGALIADLIVDRRLSCVVDVSQFATDTEKARFAAAFAERFFFRKKAAPSAVHLFLEECQEFVPQNTQRGEEHMLHHFTRMAKIGRNFGIGISLISLRPQEVNKKVLNLTECLFAFQMTGTHERKAIRDWVSAKGADEDIIAILPTLKVGVAHVYSPQWLGISQQVKAYEKRSADVSSTPTLGDAVRADSKPLAPSELAALTKAMAATIEKAKADDPRELRKEIAALRRQVEQKPSAKGQTDVEVRQHLARAVKFETRHLQVRLDRVVSAFRRYIDMVERHSKSAVEATGKLGGQSEQMRAALTEWESGASEAERTEAARTVVSPGEGEPYRQVVGRISQAPARPITARATVPADGLSRGQQKILNALAELEAIGVVAPSRAQLGMVAGYNLTGGTGAQHIADLGSAGLVEIPGAGVVRLTDAGRAVADATDVPTTLAELHERVLAKLSAGQRKIAEYLIEIYPEAISRADLGKAVTYNLTGGTGAQHMADLVTVGAAKIPGAGKVIASDLLFPEGLR